MTPSFGEARVLALESRRAVEVGTLITTFGGRATVAPALREVPAEAAPAVRAFGEALVAGELDIVILLTGVGARALFGAVDAIYGPERVRTALAATRILARGPKPLAVLRELAVPAWAVAAEPNTWREVLTALDAAMQGTPVTGLRVCVQEYGAPSEDLVDALRARGAAVTSVPVYRWALPEDLAPLQQAVHSLVTGGIDVLLLTTGIQVDHLFQVANDLGLGADLRTALASVVIASIGPSTTEALRRHRLEADLEPSHPKMGYLVREAAEQAPGLLARKRPPASDTPEY